MNDNSNHKNKKDEPKRYANAREHTTSKSSDVLSSQLVDTKPVPEYVFLQIRAQREHGKVSCIALF